MKILQTHELKTMMSEHTNLPVINTLPTDTAKDTTIPGTPNIPFNSDDFVTRVESQVGGKDQPVVVYCASSDCDASEKAATKLEENGFTKVFDFAGGVKAWEESRSGTTTASREPAPV